MAVTLKLLMQMFSFSLTPEIAIWAGRFCHQVIVPIWQDHTILWVAVTGQMSHHAMAGTAALSAVMKVWLWWKLYGCHLAIHSVHLRRQYL